MKILIACDLMLSEYGPVQTAVLLSKEFIKRGYDVSLISIKISEMLKERLVSYGIEPIDLDLRLYMKGDLLLTWFEVWAREAFFNLNSKKFHSHDAIILNFSHTMIVPSAIWFALGPTIDSLENMKSEFPLRYKLGYGILKPLISYGDKRLIKHIARSSKTVIAVSKYCAGLYEKKGITVHSVIYAPVDCTEFKPTTSKPQNNYVFTYFGGEVKFSLIKKLANRGIKIKAFGGNIPFTPKDMNHKNVEYLGHVTHTELVDLYSNAVFTLFPFTYEPFGCVPVESMACGTPVLTYGWQGPGETVVDGVTGWLARNDEEMVRLATELSENGYSSAIRGKCRMHSLNFDVKYIAEKWMAYIKNLRPEGSY